MALNRQRYTIEYLEGPLPRANRARQIRYVYRIWYTIGERHTGVVEVDAEGFDKQKAAAAMEAEVQRVSDIYSLGSS